MLASQVGRGPREACEAWLRRFMAGAGIDVYDAAEVNAHIRAWGGAWRPLRAADAGRGDLSGLWGERGSGTWSRLAYRDALPPDVLRAVHRVKERYRRRATFHVWGAEGAPDAFIAASADELGAVVFGRWGTAANPGGRSTGDRR
jgi:hypothetical protein